MQNIHPGKDLEDIVGKSVKPIAQSTSELGKATWIHQDILSRRKKTRTESGVTPMLGILLSSM